MRRTSSMALAVGIATWAGLVWAAEDAPSVDGGNIGAFATSAGALAGPKSEPASATAATAASPAPSPDASSDTSSEPSSGASSPATEQAASAQSPDATAPPVPVNALVPAKQLFGSVKSAAVLQARAIGKYSRGCLAGAVALPVDGPQWQAMRLSRNRNWGHPILISTIERLADESWRYDGWNGLLVGDIAQPRGGPMSSGHASHQIGLDADVWLTPMPARRLTRNERETLSATSMLAADEISVNRKIWTEAHYKIIKRVASFDRVERVLVHPAIKKAMCEDATAAHDDRGFLHKVRPYWGHYYHFHVRIGCPDGSTNCTAQNPPPGDDGCGRELTDWIRRVTPQPPGEPKPPVVSTGPKKPPPRPVTLADLPQECRVVLSTGKPGIPKPLLDKQARADKLIAARAKALAAAKHAHSAHGKAHDKTGEHAKTGAQEETTAGDKAHAAAKTADGAH